MDNKINILIVEDEQKVVEAIKAYLEKEGFAVSFALLGSAALNMFKEKKFALIVLDLMLPDVAGEEVCKTIRKTSDVPIIILTAKSSEEDKVKGLNIGADDYLVKPFSPRELLARVKAILRRVEGYSDKKTSSVKFKGGLEINYDEMKVFKNSCEVILTPNEYKIIAFLSKNIGRCYSREELIGNATTSEEAYDRVIDSHIKNLRHKIEDNPKAPTYIITQYGFGYKFEGFKI